MHPTRTLCGRYLRLAVFLLLPALGAGCAGDDPAEPPEPPLPQLDKATLEFGRVEIGRSVERSFRLSNVGGSGLDGFVTSACPEYLLPSGAGEFSLGSGEAREVTVRFQPVSAGSKTCRITFGNEVLGAVNCTGTGVAPSSGACCAPEGTCAITTEAACGEPNVWMGQDAPCLPNPCVQPEGACCASDGSCRMAPESACSDPSSWLGPGIACVPNPCSQPTGACCAPDGTCAVKTEAECAAPSAWMEGEAGCALNPCPQPTGACCAPVGGCAMTTEADCVAPWTWSVSEGSCSPNPCPQPAGACCAPDGACATTTEADCVAPRTWNAMEGSCSPNPCPQPTGTCCSPDGSCAVLTEAACGGPATWDAHASACSPNPCPQPIGACCAPDGRCSVTAEADCESPSAWNSGEGSCSPNPCPRPAGACCASSGGCTITTQAACAPSSTWDADESACSPNPCPQPVGACCTPSGGCTITAQAACAATSTWNAGESVCSPTPCPQPAGACCALLGACSVTTQALCLSPRVWQGAGTACSPNPCPPPAITISPGSLPNGTVGAAYGQACTGGGGTSPYTFTLAADALPTGLSLSSAGLIHGTPSAAGTFSFTVRATDAIGFPGYCAYTITITGGGTLNLSVPAVYVTQSTQTAAFDVPLVKDRDGLLRVFATAGGANSETPDVRVRVFDSGSNLLLSTTIHAPGSSVPIVVDESPLTTSWNVSLPGSLLQPGNTLLVEVDPGNDTSETDESDNTWPASGVPYPLDVRDLPVLRMSLLPVNTTSGTGNVNAGNAASYMEATRRIHPIPDFDVEVPAVLYSTATLSPDGTGWDTMLNEVTARRTVDHSTDYYFGVAHVAYTSGVAGLSWIGYPVGTGWDHFPTAPWVLAHEIGHNWNYGHTRCIGSEALPDLGYPYPGGIIGSYGYDLWAASLKDRSVYKDVMSYCSNQWISDYTYKKILDFRESSAIGLRGGSEKDLPEQPCLLVWGLRRNGRLVLEPSFLVTMRPSLPVPGPFRLEGLDASGRSLWSQDFDLRATTHPDDATSAGFCFAVPMEPDLLERTETLRLLEGGREQVRREPSAPAGRAVSPARSAHFAPARGGQLSLEWDQTSAPAVMVRDLERGQCLGFARDGHARLGAASGQLEFLFSDGIHTTVLRWPED